jgi:hypothetical protein
MQAGPTVASGSMHYAACVRSRPYAAGTQGAVSLNRFDAMLCALESGPSACSTLASGTRRPKPSDCLARGCTAPSAESAAARFARPVVRSEAVARADISRAGAHFESIGAGQNTKASIPGNRTRRRR